jgi:hypothetical protein
MCNIWITAVTMLEAQPQFTACLVVCEGCAFWQTQHAVSRITAHDVSTPVSPLSSGDNLPWHVMLPVSATAPVHEQSLLQVTQATAVTGRQTDLVVFRREVGDKRHRSLAITAVNMAQHDCLVKGLSGCNLTVMAAQVQVLASYSDVALPFLRALVLTHAMVAGGLGLKTLLLSSALFMRAIVEKVPL